MAFLEEALEYARAGWTVLPLVPGLKRPMVNWREWQDRTPSEGQIRQWWTETPNANIGAITGKDWVVVDVDSYKQGADPRKIWNKYPTDMIVRSARGGWHLYYDAKGQEIHNSATVQGIDIRGDRGVIVLPPSVFEGKEYKWVRRGSIGDFPWPILDAPKATTSGDQPKWVSEYWEGLHHGARNQGAAELAGYFEGKGLPEDVTLAMLKDWDKKNTPPLGPDEIATTVSSIYRSASRNATRKRGGRVIAAGSRVSRSNRPFAVSSFTDFMTKHANKSQTWIVDDWLMDETILMVVAAPGSYKTWLVYDLAISVATGTPLFGSFPIKKQGPVLIVQQEDSLSGVAGRFAEIVAAKLGVSLEDNESPDIFEISLPPSLPISFHEDRMLRFEDNVVMADFEAAIDAIRPTLVILDPLYSMTEVDDYMARIGEHMLKLKSLRDRYGCSFVLVHHAKKSADGTRTDAWGSTFVNASREGGWQITKPDELQEPDRIQLRRFFKDGEEFAPIDMKIHIDTKSKEHAFDITISDTPKPKAADTTEMIINLLSKKQMTEQEVSNLTGRTPQDTKKILRSLADDGQIMRYGRKWGMPLVLDVDFE